MKRVIWFNHSLSAVNHVIRAMKQGACAGDFFIVSNKNPVSAAFLPADHYFHEDIELSGEEYATWALTFVKAHHVTHFFVGRGDREILGRRKAFAEAGVKLLNVARVEDFEDLDNKRKFYERLEQSGLGYLLPQWRVWNDSYLNSLKDHVDIITAKGRTACVKPVEGIFGNGFFRFLTAVDPDQQLFHPEKKIIDFLDFGRLACAGGNKAGAHRDWLVMEYLSGPEYSVDALGYEGRLVAQVTRKKADSVEGGQEVVLEQDIEQAVVQLADAFKLTGCFNVQLRRDDVGAIKILEINRRFSGGIGMSLHAGINLPDLWIRLADGEADVVASVVNAGIRVNYVPCPTILKQGAHA